MSICTMGAHKVNVHDWEDVNKLICTSARPAKVWPVLCTLGYKSEASRSLRCLEVTTEFLAWVDILLFVWAQPASWWRGNQSTEGKNSCLFTNYAWIFKCACWPLIMAASLGLLLHTALGHGCWRGSKWTELLVRHVVRPKANRQGCAKYNSQKWPQEMNASINLATLCKDRPSLSVRWRHLLQSTLSWSWKPIWEKADMQGSELR